MVPFPTILVYSSPPATPAIKGVRGSFCNIGTVGTLGKQATRFPFGYRAKSATPPQQHRRSSHTPTTICSLFSFCYEHTRAVADVVINTVLLFLFLLFFPSVCERGGLYCQERMECMFCDRHGSANNTCMLMDRVLGFGFWLRDPCGLGMLHILKTAGFPVFFLSRATVTSGQLTNS